MTPHFEIIESVPPASFHRLLPGIQNLKDIPLQGNFSLILAQNAEHQTVAFSLLHHLSTAGGKARILRLHAHEQYYSLFPALIEQSELLAKKHRHNQLLFLLSDVIPEFSLIKQALLNRLWTLPARTLSWGIMPKKQLLQASWMQRKPDGTNPLRLQLWNELPQDIRDKINTLSSKVLALAPPLPIDPAHSFAIYHHDTPFGWCLTQRLRDNTLLIISLRVKRAHPFLFSLLAKHLHESHDIEEVAYYYPLSGAPSIRFFEKRLHPISREAHRLYLSMKSLHA